VIETAVATPDGRAGAQLLLPSGTGPWAGVLFYMDGLGIRPGLVGMAHRLAEEGYAVLLPDLYYRCGDYAPFDPGTALSDPAERRRLDTLFRSIDGHAVMRDTGACLDFLAGRPDVRRGPVGCVGYCMGGGHALLAAARYPERVGAAASFHAANLANDSEQSPHRFADCIRGEIYVGVAEKDPWLAEGETERLRAALEEARVRNTIEIYAGTQHGFAVPDLPVFDPAAAATHWQRLLALFDRTLRR